MYEYYDMSMGQLVHINWSDYDQCEIVEREIPITIGFGDIFPTRIRQLIEDMRNNHSTIITSILHYRFQCLYSWILLKTIWFVTSTSGLRSFWSIYSLTHLHFYNTCTYLLFLGQCCSSRNGSSIISSLQRYGKYWTKGTLFLILKQVAKFRMWHSFRYLFQYASTKTYLH